MHAHRDFRGVRIELVHRAADDRCARALEKRLPRLVDAEVLAVAALEEHRVGQRLEQVLGLALRFAQFRLAASQVLGDLARDAVSALARGGKRADQAGEQHADRKAAAQHEPRHDRVARRAKCLQRRAELQVPSAPADLERGVRAERIGFDRAACAVVEAFARVRDAQPQLLQRVARHDVANRVARAERDADDAVEALAARLRTLESPGAPVDREAQADATLIGQRERDRAARHDGAGIARALNREAPHRVGDDIEAERALVGRKRSDVGDDNVLGALACRADSESRIAAAMQAAVAPYCADEALLLRLRDALRIAEAASLARILLRRELGDVALEAGAIEIRLRLKQALHPEQQELVAAQPCLERMP